MLRPQSNNTKLDLKIESILQEQPFFKSISSTEVDTPVRVCAYAEGLFNELRRQETLDVESAGEGQSEDTALGFAY